jgi:hypothetical protein
MQARYVVRRSAQDASFDMKSTRPSAELTDKPAHLLQAFCGRRSETGSGLKPIGAVCPVNPATITALVAVTNPSSPTK